MSVVCVDDATPAPPGAWVCPATTTVECAGPDGATVGKLYTDAGVSCDDAVLTADIASTFPLGTHDVAVTITPAQGEASVCHATVSVVDTQPPVLTSKTTSLWPPNHKMTSLSPSDCVDVVDTCDPSVRLFFTYATSDEAADGTGDGATGEDIVLGCDSVQLRSERKGNGDARVYTLGVRAVDDSGNVTDGSCRVIVDHDQGKKGAVDSGQAYRVDAPACP